MSQLIALHQRKNPWPTILWVGLLVGYLDISSAVINFTFSGKGNPERILRYIASAVFGPKAYSGDSSFIYFGLAFHFLIAYAFTIFFFLVYPKINFLSKNRLLTGILYGLFIWIIMNLAVVPLMLTHRIALKWDFQMYLNMVILMVMIGIPLSYFAYWYYKKRG